MTDPQDRLQETAASSDPVPETPETAAVFPESEEGKDYGPDYLRMTLNAGVAPLEMRFSQINHCYRKVPVAYRSFTYVNSVVEGVIPPEKYAYAADETERGMRLACWNIRQAVQAARRMEDAGRHVEFITARCPAQFARENDPYAYVKRLLEEEHCTAPEKLCLEFPRTLLYEPEEAARAMVLSMKLLKVRTMMSGCGEKDAPLTPLLQIPLDYVTVAPWVTVLADDRSKGASVTALFGFLRSLPCEVIADGVCNDEQISALSRADCFGYIPSSAYQGSVFHGRLRMMLEEAVAQREEEES